MNAIQLAYTLLLFLGIMLGEIPTVRHAYKAVPITFEMERLQFIYRYYFNNRRGRRQRLKDTRRGLCA